MKTFIILLMMILLTTLVSGQKKVVLPGVINPTTFTYPLTVDENNLYVVDGINVLIYSKKDFTLIKKIGKAGEGPGEFIGADGGKSVTANITKDKIVVSSVNRLSYFTKEGKFINELKTSDGFMFISYQDKYIGYSFINESNQTFTTLNFYNTNFKKSRELGRSTQFSLETSFSPFFTIRAKPIVYQDKLYVGNPDTGDIVVYDQNGKKLSTISYNYKSIKLKETDKNILRGFYKNDVRLKIFYPKIKKLIDFPVYFPNLKNFHISDNKIYVLTYGKKDNLSEFLVFDLEGKFLKSVFYPLKEVSLLETYPYTVYKGKIYHLIAGEESDNWELLIDDLK